MQQVQHLNMFFYRFAGQTYIAHALVLVTISAYEIKHMKIVVNSEKLVIGSMMLTDLKQALK